ncbi:NDP-sugar synthase [Rhodococcus sp. IEGM 1330]|uniref:nucleotidyltransferase family protein n=1 Tax=Rhodococcus sp. IEGM 1330 TaxID=3082225 RepID=UPI0029547592|nr:NTP transferase domain-containing protein [Rhodococcus sp. IEGM 1330]MDV8023802.1 NTP transferase domain-containing protein [Rhodococcus sp. IEGM 1330]
MMDKIIECTRTVDVTAVLLCAGLGTRSETVAKFGIPKCLIPVDGTPFLGCLIGWLRKSGIVKVIVVVHGYSDAISEFLEYGPFENTDIEIVTLTERRDTNWATHQGLKKVKTRRALVLVADTVWKIDLQRFFSHDFTLDVCVPLTKPRPLCNRNFAVDRRGRVVEIGALPTRRSVTYMTGTGIYLITLSDAVIEGLNRGGDLDTTGFAPDDLRIGSYSHVGPLVDFGTDPQLTLLRNDLQYWPEFFNSTDVKRDLNYR